MNAGTRFVLCRHVVRMPADFVIFCADNRNMLSVGFLLSIPWGSSFGVVSVVDGVGVSSPCKFSFFDVVAVALVGLY